MPGDDITGAILIRNPSIEGLLIAVAALLCIFAVAWLVSGRRRELWPGCALGAAAGAFAGFVLIGLLAAAGPSRQLERAPPAVAIALVVAVSLAVSVLGAWVSRRWMTSSERRPP
jgi:hypothetical protein